MGATKRKRMTRRRCAARSSSCLASRYRPSDCLHHLILNRRLTIESSAPQHAFILPEELRPVKLVGSGTAGVVLCCADAGGDMVAVKKIISDSDRAFQRSLREVAPLPQRKAAQRSCSRPQRSWLTDHRAGSAHVPAASSQHRECRRRVLFDRHRAVCERVLCGPSAGRFRSHAVLPRRSRVAHPLQPASADERAYSGAPVSAPAAAPQFLRALTNVFAATQYILVQVLCGLR